MAIAAPWLDAPSLGTEAVLFYPALALVVLASGPSIDTGRPRVRHAACGRLTAARVTPASRTGRAR